MLDRSNELSKKAVGLWNNRNFSYMRGNCVKTASKFDKGLYLEKWLNVLLNPIVQ
jgi:hypothetical protein